MNPKFVFMILIIFRLIGPEPAAGQVILSKPAIKKVDNTISLLWPEIKVLREQPVFSSSTSSIINKHFNERDFYILRNQETILGYLIIKEAKGKAENFSYAVFFKPDLTIKSVQLLDYRESYGYEIGNAKWLRQFENRQGKEFVVGTDIRNISGATISVKSITESLQKLCLGIQELRAMGIL